MSPNNAKATEVAKSLASSEQVGYLMMRWEDERQYENPEEYRAALARLVPADVKVTRFIKRPFGFRFEIGASCYDLKFYASGRINLKGVSHGA